MKKSLQEKLSNISNHSGVYLFKDLNQKVIYVGKAKILRNRVRSYFQTGRTDSPKVETLVRHIHDLETIVTDSEIEALILEANLIKQYKPRYNVNLKDDKSFPYIRVTNEKFPRIFPTRKIIKDGSKYFGPYTDVASMRALLKTVKRLFPIRSCNLNLTDKTIERGKFKVCINYHINKCLGPCEGLINEQEYKCIVNNIIDFINGRSKIVIEELEKKMEKAALNQEYEKAARIRDQLNAIQDFQYKQKVISTEFKNQDFITVSREENDACGVVFIIREGRVTGRQHYYLNNVEGETTALILNQFLTQYYLKTESIPQEIFIPEYFEDMENVEQWLTQKANCKVNLKVPAKGEKAKLIRMAEQNAKLLLEELKLQKMKAKDYIPHAVKALQRDLRLKKPPVRIEAFDISNISGTNPTASMVTFINGQAHKGDYRRFKIRSKSTPDDYKMMAEAIERRYSGILKDDLDMPDLILVDGGKGQLGAAIKVLDQLEIKNQPIIALAKRLDEVFVPGISDPQNIPRTSSGLKLLQRIRDEAHRFAVTYHRSLRQKNAVYSELDGIAGIGKTRKVKLIKHFGSLNKLKNATIEEIANVKGIPKILAENIYQYFQKSKLNNGSQQK